MINMNDIISIKRCSSYFKISWKMTNWCNYHCDYCYMSNKVKETATNTPINTLIKIASEIDNIIEIQAKNRPVCLHLIGGEVGYFNLIDIIDHIKSKNLKLVIIATNLSSSLLYWMKLYKYLLLRECELKIIGSLHLSQCDPQEFIKKIKMLGNVARIKCVINNNNVDEYKKLFSGLDVKIQPTVERIEYNENSTISTETKEYVDFLNKKLSESSKPYYKIFMKNGQIITFYSNIEMINNIENGGLDPNGFLCTAGIDGLRIDVDGSLRRAGCQWCGNKINWLGSLITGKYELPKEPIKCQTTIFHKIKQDYIHKYCTAFGNTSISRVN